MRGVHRYQRFAVLFMVVCMLAAVLVPARTEAADTAAKAMKAYSKFLKKHASAFTAETGDFETKNTEPANSARYFMAADLNGDDVPELMTYHEDGYKTGRLYVYTYTGKKVKRRKTIELTNTTSDTAESGLEIFVCSQHHLHVTMQHGAGADRYVYYMKKNKVKLYGKCEDLRNVAAPSTYQLKGSEVTKEEYDEVFADCQAETWLAENTAENREQILK